MPRIVGSSRQKRRKNRMKKNEDQKLPDSSPQADASKVGVKAGRVSVFDATGFKKTIEALCEEVRELYAEDDVPWIIGYSGGKDSTAILQVIWMALEGLPESERRKTVHVISTDTLVENPVVAQWVSRSLEVMGKTALEKNIPVVPHRLTPGIEDSFWVNLIGRGYPAPRQKFRWCTARLKISPSNTFINGIVKQSGEAILVLGTRKAESSRRAASMKSHEKWRVRDRLSPNAGLPGSLVYTPIEDWTNDDVWMFLTRKKNVWGFSNTDLLGMYAGATADGKCPLVVDTGTPSCGDSRFGCWVCTLVDKDKSMSAMVHNDAEKEWMMPLLSLRNLLDFREDAMVKNPKTGKEQRSDAKLKSLRSPVGAPFQALLTKRVKGKSAAEAIQDPQWERSIRDFRRLKTGSVQMMRDGRHIPGPYLQDARECWLRSVLIAQQEVRARAPKEVAGIELITLDELQEIRRIWVIDKHELEDRLPAIYEEVIGEEYPGRALDDQALLGEEEMAVLESVCGEDRLHFELTRELISMTIQQQNSGRRAGLYKRLESSLKKHFYEDKEDALDRAKRLDTARRGDEDVEQVSIPTEEGAVHDS